MGWREKQKDFRKEWYDNGKMNNKAELVKGFKEKV